MMQTQSALPPPHGWVYVLTNRVNGKQYAGQETKCEGGRWGDHLVDSRKEKPPSIIAKAIQKHGAENFTRETVAIARSQICLNEAETAIIHGLKTMLPYGYNVALEGGSPMKGRNQSEASKLKQSESRKGIVIGAKQRESIRRGLSGKPKSAEHTASVKAARWTPERRAEWSKRMLGNQLAKK